MKVSYEGVAEQVVTFQVDGASNPAVQVGTVVALSGNGTVKACPASTAPAGVVLGVKDGLAAVQVPHRLDAGVQDGEGLLDALEQQGPVLIQRNAPPPPLEEGDAHLLLQP